MVGEPQHFDEVRRTLAYICRGQPCQKLDRNAFVANLPAEKALSYPEFATVRSISYDCSMFLFCCSMDLPSVSWVHLQQQPIWALSDSWGHSCEGMMQWSEVLQGLCSRLCNASALQLMYSKQELAGQH